MKKRFLLGTLIVTLVLLLSSCYTPSPLYGTWTDNTGDKLVFMQDGTFSASVVNSENASIKYDGTWTCIDQIIVFNISGGKTMNSEWDVRGALLYLNWTENNKIKNLTLYHTAR